jgi:succinate-acetate transporter protein
MKESQVTMEERAPASAVSAVPAHGGQAAGPAAVATPTLSFADPTALGLFGLAIGCASLLPLAFGVKSAFLPEAIRTTAMICLLFGGGCQFLAGIMSFANKNMLGGTLLTTFSFNWVMNWWSLDGLVNGRAQSPTVVLALDLCFIVIFFAMTYAFGFFSRLLFVFLLDIDALYALRIVGELTHSKAALALPIAASTVILMALAIYIAVALVLVNAAGKSVLPMGGPLYGPGAQPGAAPVGH